MTTKAFGAQLLSLPEIFKDNFFTIPDYQRGYAWDEKQVNELLRDVEHLMTDSSTLRHYTGTLVLSKPEQLAEREFHVVDGQQRLTTLTIFLRQLCLRLPPEKRSDFTALYLTRGCVGSERQVLRLNSDTRKFFDEVVLRDGNTDHCIISLDSHQRLLDASILIGKWLDDQLDNGVDIAVIRNALEQRLGFLVYAPKEDAETGIMFEVINNRGKPLSELEKVKNYLIYCSVKLTADSLRTKIDDEWSDILQRLSKAKKTTPVEESSFLRYCLVVYLKLNKTDSQDGYEQLKDKLKLSRALNNDQYREQLIVKITNLVEFMKTAALWYQRLYASDHGELSTEMVDVLDQLRAQNRHASIMPLFLALVIRLKGQGRELVRLLQLLEILNFRVYIAKGMTARTDTGQGELYGLAAAYFHGTVVDRVTRSFPELEPEFFSSDEDALEFRLSGFAYRFASENRFRKSLQLEADSPEDFYKWSGLSYFLMNYEASLQPKKTIRITRILSPYKNNKTADYPSIEHLWATKNRSERGENDRKQDEYQKRRLGNFVLLELRLNIQGCNDDLQDKLPRYLQGLEHEAPSDYFHLRVMAKDVEQVLSELSHDQTSVDFFHNLHSKLNDLQEQRFEKFALQRWSLEPFAGYEFFRNTREDALEVSV